MKIINAVQTKGPLTRLYSDGSFESINDYEIIPLDFWYDIKDQRFYTCKWRIIERSKNIDLIVTPIFSDQVMRLMENHPLAQQVLEELFPGACFWEGVCRISGTINGSLVNGKAYAELTHSYEKINNINIS